MDGHLQFKGNKFHVEPTYYVRGNVDFGVGNINYMGDVHITGDVRENFVIQATGNITIGGIVEGAVIEAGGDVSVGSGILGDDKAVIKAGGSVRAAYIENAIVFASGDVYAGSIIASEVFSDTKIEVRTGRGTIIGGQLVAGQKIDATCIGSRAERLTRLVGGELPYVQKQREEIQTTLSHLAEEIAGIEKELQSIDGMEIDQMTPEMTKKGADYRLRKSVLGMQEAHFKKELEEIEEKSGDLSKCRVTAVTIYPITEIRLLDQSVVVRDKLTGHSDVHLEDGVIQMI